MLQLADVNMTRGNAIACRERGAYARTLASDPALWNFAHEAMRIAVAGYVPAAGEQAIQGARHKAPIGNGDVRKFRRHRGRDAYLVLPNLPAGLLRAGN